MLAALYDIALLYKKTWLVRLLYAGFFLTGLPFVFFFFLHTSPHPVALQVVLLLLMGFFLLLTIYSVLLELPCTGTGHSIPRERTAYAGIRVFFGILFSPC